MRFSDIPDPKAVSAQENIPLLESIPAAKKTVSKMMLILAIVLIAVQALGTLLVLLLQVAAPWVLQQSWINWLLSIVTIYGIGFPLLYFFTQQKVPATPVKQQKLPLWVLLLCFFFLVGLTFLGAVLGNGLAVVLDAIRGKTSTDPVSEVVGSSPLWMNILAAVVIAPITESFFFCKILLDRVGIYGEGFAVAVSAISFGLYHGNLYQLFYTALVGALFAYVYLRSGNVWYTVVLHAAMNAYSGIFASQILSHQGAGGVWAVCDTVYNVILYLGLLLTVALLPSFRGYGKRPAEQPLPRGTGTSTAMGNVGMCVLAIYSLASVVVTFLTY